MRRIIGLLWMVVAGAGSCLACAVPVAPEIDSTTVGAAIALVGGGFLVIQYRRKK